MGTTLGSCFGRDAGPVQLIVRQRHVPQSSNGALVAQYRFAENFERTVESVTVNFDVGVVMGGEVFTPTAQGELGRTYGAVALKRRYTNVYVREGAAWLWFARHANVVLTK